MTSWCVLNKPWSSSIRKSLDLINRKWQGTPLCYFCPMQLISAISLIFETEHSRTYLGIKPYQIWRSQLKISQRIIQCILVWSLFPFIIKVLTTFQIDISIRVESTVLKTWTEERAVRRADGHLNSMTRRGDDYERKRGAFEMNLHNLLMIVYKCCAK